MTRKYRIKNAKNNKQLIGDQIELETIIKKKMTKYLNRTITINKRPNVSGKKSTFQQNMLEFQQRMFTFEQRMFIFQQNMLEFQRTMLEFVKEQRKFNKEQSELLQKVIKLNNLKTE
ncbi:MAG: hypothetical protein LBS95_01665 [Mycoplasmataceae bacterium]|jgi:hypothetical protein|nr:hypothetical protein [Mycoplasmataceae bacterium]